MAHTLSAAAPGILWALVAASSLLTSSPIAAQDGEQAGWSVGVAGQVLSRFIWRGQELHDGPSLQPDLWLERGGLSFGVWSSWAFDGDYREVNTYVSWDRELPAGTLTLVATDYYYPEEGLALSDFRGVRNGEPTGAHTLEMGAGFSPSAFPLWLMIAWNVHNDPDHALFGAVGSDVSLPGFELAGQVGLLLNDSPYEYEAEAGSVLSYSVSARRGITLGDLEPFVSAAVVRSALLHRTYWVFAAGF